MSLEIIEMFFKFSWVGVSHFLKCVKVGAKCREALSFLSKGGEIQ